MSIFAGQVIDGKYRVVAQIGAGGMGAVYACEDLQLRRRVAIKVLHVGLARHPETVRRFEREAQAAGRIGNDHILQVLDIGQLPQGDRYVVMELLDGESLEGRLRRLGRLTPRQIYPVVKQLLEGLAAAHAAGIVHRDLKPANVFLLRERMGFVDYVKLIDFGISKFQSAGDLLRTGTGAVLGTPRYMSPEQARGLRETDARSDIYAVGVMLYEAVTGRTPFQGPPAQLLVDVISGDVPPIESVALDVDPGFSSIVMRALARDPADRFETANALIAALDVWINTGAGVSSVPAGGLRDTVIERRGALRVSVRPPPDARTQGSWTESASGAPPPMPAARGRRKWSVATGAGLAVCACLAWVVGHHLRAVHERRTSTVAAATSGVAAPIPSSVTSVSSAPTDAPPPSAPSISTVAPAKETMPPTAPTHQGAPSEATRQNTVSAAATGAAPVAASPAKQRASHRAQAAANGAAIPAPSASAAPRPVRGTTSAPGSDFGF